MLTAKEKQERLAMAIALLHDADAMMQAALGDTEECFDLHCGFEALIDDVRDTIDAMEANA